MSLLRRVSAATFLRVLLDEKEKYDMIAVIIMGKYGLGGTYGRLRF